MLVHLRIDIVGTICRVRIAAEPPIELAATPLDALPPFERLRANPFEEGALLYQALGGTTLRDLLDQDDAGVLLY